MFRFFFFEKFHRLFSSFCFSAAPSTRYWRRYFSTGNTFFFSRARGEGEPGAAFPVLFFFLLSILSARHSNVFLSARPTGRPIRAGLARTAKAICHFQDDGKQRLRSTDDNNLRHSFDPAVDVRWRPFFREPSSRRPAHAPLLGLFSCRAYRCSAVCALFIFLSVVRVSDILHAAIPARPSPIKSIAGKIARAEKNNDCAKI